MIVFKNSLLIMNDSRSFSWSGSVSLFSILAGGTFWWSLELTGGSVEALLHLHHGKNTRPHQKLNLLEADVAESMVPM
jgi:hypothetical protein